MKTKIFKDKLFSRSDKNPRKFSPSKILGYTEKDFAIMKFNKITYQVDSRPGPSQPKQKGA